MAHIFYNGVHEGIRTPDRTLRRRMLYPAELRRPNCLNSIAYYHYYFQV